LKSQASAPGKIILFGEHFVVYGVRAILCAIDKRVTVSAEKISENMISIKSSIGNLKESPQKKLKEIDNQLRPVYYLADKMIQKYKEKSGIEIKIESEIPSGVGLGSSSACCVASAAAISGLFTRNSKEEILQMAIEAEKTIFPNTSGADTTVCTYGGLMQYDKKKGYSKISCRNNFDLIIANSKIRHSTQKVVSNVEKFKKKNEKKFSSICNDVNKLIDDALIHIKNNDLEGIGKNLTKNQEYLESIGVSNEKLREMIEVSKKFSFGSKLTGAGDGGCIFSIIDKSNLEKTMRQLERENYECFSVKIDFTGLDTF